MSNETDNIGSPVQNSGSPKIHNAVFEHLGLDYAHIAFDVQTTIV